MTRRLTLLATLALACAGDSTPRVAPTTGAQAGGDAIRIEGSDFAGHGAAVVYIGNRAAKNVVIEGPRLITVMTPQTDELGAVDVHVQFEDGTELTLPSAFTFEQQSQIVLQ